MKNVRCAEWRARSTSSPHASVATLMATVHAAANGNASANGQPRSFNAKYIAKNATPMNPAWAKFHRPVTFCDSENPTVSKT